MPGFPAGPLAVLLALLLARFPRSRVRKVTVTDTTSWRHAPRKWCWSYGSMAAAQERKSASTRGAALAGVIPARLLSVLVLLRYFRQQDSSAALMVWGGGGGGGGGCDCWHVGVFVLV